MTKEFKDAIPHLNIEVLPGGLIRLENESMGDSYVVDIHPVHLRHIAEKIGLIAETSASDAELLRTERGRVAELQRDMGRYKRALLAIRERSEQLYQNIHRRTQEDAMDVGIEVAQAAALSDFSEHICIEFEDEFTTTGGHAADKKHNTGLQIPGTKASLGTDSRQMAMEV